MDKYLEHPSIKASDVTHVHPWDVITNRLGQELDSDPDLFRKVLYFLPEKEPHKCVDIKNSQTYFAYLESVLEENGMLDYLIDLMEHMISLYIDLGTVNVADLLKSFKQELDDMQCKLEQEGMLKDKKFVGREQYIADIKTSLTESSSIKGVCICGLGGLGKTSLAREICIDLGNKWTIYKIDLREKSNLKDLLRSSLDAYQEICHGDSVKDLEEQLFNLLETRKAKKEVLLFDNVDDIIIREVQQFNNFLANLLQTLNRIGSLCKIRIIVTSRQKLSSTSTINVPEYELHKRKLRFGGLLEEIELKPLKQQDALRLVDLCTDKIQVPHHLSKQMIELCGSSPLAIRTVSSIIRDGNVSPRQIISNLKSDKPSMNTFEMSGIFTCLQQTFDTLELPLQRKLVQLSIFQAAPFDIFAAAKVFGAEEVTKNRPIVINAQFDMLYLKSHHLVEIEKIRHSSSDSEDTVVKPIGTSPRRIEYSLHPLVSLFLLEKSKTKLFVRDIYAAQRRFVSHYKIVVNKFGELEEKNYWKAQSVLEKNKVHLLHFFKLLQSKSPPEYDMECSKSTHDDILSTKRLADLVSFMLDDFERLQFFQNAYKSSDERLDPLCAILWRVQEGTLLYEMDRRHLVSDVLIEIEGVFSSIEGYERDAIAAVTGNYYYLKGRYNIDVREFQEAIVSLQTAEKCFLSIKSVKKNYISSLARVYNSMGNIYYKRPPMKLDMAKMCYEKALKLILSKTDNEYKNLDIPCYLTNIATCLYREGLNLEKEEKYSRQKYQEALECYKIAIKCDLQMKMRESEDFAHKLFRRADVLARLGHFDHAEDDIKESLRLRRSLLAPPHEFITLTTHKVGDILKQKAMKMYKNNEPAYKVINVIYEARVYYQETLDLIKDGGLAKDHPDYSEIKENHLWLERQVEEQDELRKIKISYKKFEHGKYEERAAARHSMDATVVDHMSREQKMKLLQSSDERWKLVQHVGWQTSPDSDEDFSEDICDEEDNLHLLAAIKAQTADTSRQVQQISDDLSSLDSPSVDMDEEEVFFEESKNVNRRRLDLDGGNSFLSFLENYIPSSSGEFGEDFWYLLSESEEISAEAEISRVNTEERAGTTRKRPSSEIMHPKKGKID